MPKVEEVYVVWNEGDAKYFLVRGLTRKRETQIPFGNDKQEGGSDWLLWEPTLATMRPSRRWGTRR